MAIKMDHSGFGQWQIMGKPPHFERHQSTDTQIKPHTLHGENNALPCEVGFRALINAGTQGYELLGFDQIIDAVPRKPLLYQPCFGRHQTIWHQFYQF